MKVSVSLAEILSCQNLNKPCFVVKFLILKLQGKNSYSSFTLCQHMKICHLVCVCACDGRCYGVFLLVAKRFAESERLQRTTHRQKQTNKMSWLKLLIGADESKLHSNRIKREQRTQPAISWIDGSADFVSHAGPLCRSHLRRDVVVPLAIFHPSAPSSPSLPQP